MSERDEYASALPRLEELDLWRRDGFEWRVELTERGVASSVPCYFVAGAMSCSGSIERQSCFASFTALR